MQRFGIAGFAVAVLPFVIGAQETESGSTSLSISRWLIYRAADDVIAQPASPQSASYRGELYRAPGVIARFDGIHPNYDIWSLRQSSSGSLRTPDSWALQNRMFELRNRSFQQHDIWNLRNQMTSGLRQPDLWAMRDRMMFGLRSGEIFTAAEREFMRHERAKAYSELRFRHELGMDLHNLGNVWDVAVMHKLPKIDFPDRRQQSAYDRTRDLTEKLGDMRDAMGAFRDISSAARYEARRVLDTQGLLRSSFKELGKYVVRGAGDGIGAGLHDLRKDYYEVQHSSGTRFGFEPSPITQNQIFDNRPSWQGRMSTRTWASTRVSLNPSGRP